MSWYSTSALTGAEEEMISSHKGKRKIFPANCKGHQIYLKGDRVHPWRMGRPSQGLTETNKTGRTGKRHQERPESGFKLGIFWIWGDSTNNHIPAQPSNMNQMTLLPKPNQKVTKKVTCLHVAKATSKIKSKKVGVNCCYVILS